MTAHRRRRFGRLALVLAIGILGTLAPRVASAETVPYDPVVITTTTLPDATADAPYDVAFAFTGGCVDADLYWFTSSLLPTGLALDPSGRLVGTPTSSGTFAIRFTVLDRTCHEFSTQPIVTLTVTGGAFSFDDSPLPTARTGQPYDVALAVTSPEAVAPLTWSMTAGSLPPGLVLRPDGHVAGQMTTSYGDGAFIASVTDGAGVTAARRYPLSTRNSPTIRKDPLRSVTVGDPYPSTALRVDYAVGAVTWALTSGALPPGVTLSPEGVLSGLTTTTGSYPFGVTVTETASGITGSANLAITVWEPLALSTTSLRDGAAGHTYSDRLQAANAQGGIAPQFSIIRGRLPVGLTLDSLGPITGEPREGGTFPFTAQVRDGEGRLATKDLSITVSPPVAPDGLSSAEVQVSHAGATLIWYTPFDGGSTITGYTVEVIRDGTVVDAPTFAGDPAHYGRNSMRLDGLELGASYAFRITPANGIGPGPAWTSKPVTIIEPPGAPTDVAVTPGNAQATVTWKAPTWDGKSAIYGYRIEVWNGATRVNETIANNWGSVRSKLVQGLPNQVPLTFTVRAINDDGPGDPSVAAGPVTLDGPVAPGRPTITKAVVGAGSVALAWSPPSDDGGSKVDSYDVSVYDRGQLEEVVTVKWAGTSTTISGLNPGWVATFRVAAHNPYGTGLESAPVDVLIGTPGVPGFQTAQPGNAGAKVAWTAAPANGFAVTSYTVTPYIGDVAQPSTTVAAPATSVQLTGLANGTTYTFAVAAENEYGLGPSVRTAPVLVGAPTGPGFVNAVPELTSARVSWSGATANGTALTGYEVTPYVGSTALATRTFPVSPNGQVITGLTTGTTYTFKIAARSSAGLGPASTAGPITVGTPGPPGYQSASPGNGTATLRFLTPPANQSPITGYTVWPVRNGVVGPAQVFDTPGATVLDVTGLANGSSYSFRVAATNGLGQGPYATTNTVTVGTPAAPAFPSAQPGTTSAKVAWTAAPANGSPITGYAVTPYLGSVAKPTQTFAGTATSVTVTGLINGQSYTFRVAAVNAVGTGLAAATPTPVKVGTPTSPVFPSAKPGDKAAIVAAGAPTPNGGPITGYVVTPMVGTTAKPAQTFAGAGTTWIVTGLTNGTTYTFRVAAVNAFGTGPYATTGSVKVGTPSAPTGITATSGVRSATVSWTTPSGNGSPITGYVITPYIGSVAQAPKSIDASATTATITGLAVGTAYTFRVQAVNALGTGLPSSATAAVTPT